MRFGRLLSRFSQKALVLLYHRVIDSEFDPQLLAVSPQNFAEQLDFLRTNFSVMKLADLLNAVKMKDLPDRAVAITFDDGYSDNFQNAKPLLERFVAPATFFVVSGSVGSNLEFWWDDLERLVLQPGILPEDLTIRIGQQLFEARLNGSASYSKEDYEQNRSWNVARQQMPSARHQLYMNLHGRLRKSSQQDRRKALEDLAHLSEKGIEGRQTHATMSAEEVVRLANSALFQIGAHSVHHEQLSSLTREDQKREIDSSKTALEQMIARSVSSFAYPYGTRSDYDETTLMLVRQAGFRLACSNFQATIRNGQIDAFQIPRFLVRDYGATELKSKLRKWFAE